MLAAFVFWQVLLQRRQLAASERPCVYPITPSPWLKDLGGRGRWLAFRNGGPGIAQNVRGELWWHDENGHTVLVGQTLGPGDHFRVWLLDQKRVTRWFGAEGYVIYEDVRGDEWQSRFRYEHDGRQVWARLDEWDRSSQLGDPQVAFPRDEWAEEKPPHLPEPGESVYERRGLTEID